MTDNKLLNLIHTSSGALALCQSLTHEQISIDTDQLGGKKVSQFSALKMTV